MIPILTATEMRRADAAAVARRGSVALVEAAGTAVALQAKRMLGSCYGARVAIVVGPGLNGADGRTAARWLAARGSRTDVIGVDVQPPVLVGYDLVIDAAFGLGCTRPYVAPLVAPGTPVLAVDLPSGVDPDSGVALGTPMRADVTLAIGALKYAHVSGPCVDVVGDLRIAGLGIADRFESGLVEDADLDGLFERGRHNHKWSHAVEVLAGSPLMPGAAQLVIRGAQAGGASMIRLASRGSIASAVRLPPEVVHSASTSVDRRCRAVVAGPGLGADAASWLRERLTGLAVPVVLDADGLDRSLIPVDPAVSSRWILTPHAGEFARLSGEAPSAHRVEAVRSLARATATVVLLKGPMTIVADPQGRVRVVRAGTTALATAGSGDVLAGLIGSFIARGHDTLDAAALAAQLHGRASVGLASSSTASDLAQSIADLLVERQRARLVRAEGA